VAGNPIKIRLEAETQSAERDLAGVADKLDDVSDSLKDVDRAGSDASRGLDRSMGKVEDSTKDAGRVIDRDLTDALKDAAKQSKKTGDDIGRNIDKGTRQASEGTTSMKENAASNAKEMAGSFQDVNSALDGMQGFLAEAAEGFGTAGIAAGVLGGVALGALVASLQSAADKANELTQNAADFATEMGSSDLQGQATALRDRFQEMLAAINDVRSVWEVWQSRAITNAEQLSSAVNDGALSAETLVAAFTSTDPETRIKNLKSAIEGLDRSTTALNDEVVAGSTAQGFFNRSERDSLLAIQDKIKVQGAAKGILQDYLNQEQAAAEITRAFAEAQGLTVAQYYAQQQASQDAEQAQSAYQSTIESMASASSIFGAALADNDKAIQDWATQNKVSVDEAKATWEGAPLTLDEVLTELANRTKSRRDFEANLADLGARGFGALAEKLREGGPEANGAVVDMLSNGTDAQVQQFAEGQGYLLGEKLTRGTATKIADAGGTFQAAVDTATGNLRPITIPIAVDASGLRRDITQALDGSFGIRVNGRVIGVRLD